VGALATTAGLTVTTGDAGDEVVAGKGAESVSRNSNSKFSPTHVEPVVTQLTVLPAIAVPEDDEEAH
jgi:hypothetical protein